MSALSKAAKGLVALGSDVGDDVLNFIMRGDGKGPPATVSGPSMTDPRYKGAAPDRSNVSFLRYKPKAPSARVAQSLEALRNPENPVRGNMMADIDRGLQLGGADWYNTEELRDWFTHYLGEEQGDLEWRQFMDLMGAASPGSKVDPNIGNASAIRRRLATDPEYAQGLLGVQGLDDAIPYGKTREKGYGHKTQGLQELIAARQQQGAWSGAPEPGVAPAKGSWTDNPKPKGFTNSLIGNQRNIAADLHFTRYMAMASQHPDWLENTADVSADFVKSLTDKNPSAKKYIKTRNVNGKEQFVFSPKKAVKSGDVNIADISDYPTVWSSKPNDNEYGAFEDFIAEVGKERGLTPAQVQAALWMGAADRTGVDEGSQKIFMDVFRDRADRRAKKTGMTREQVIEDFIVNKGLLALPPVAAAGAGMLQGGQAEAAPMSPEDEMIQYLKSIEAQYR